MIALDETQTAFSLDSGEGCSDQASSITGFHQNQLTIYPNPVRDHFMIEGLQVKFERGYELFTLSGKQIEKGMLNNDGKGVLPIDLPPSTCLMQMVDGSTVRLIKR